MGNSKFNTTYMRCGGGVTAASGRRFDVVSTNWWRYHCVTYPPGMRCCHRYLQCQPHISKAMRNFPLSVVLGSQLFSLKTCWPHRFSWLCILTWIRFFFSLFYDGNIKNINNCWDPLTPCNIWRTVATRKIYILGLLGRIHDVRIRVGRRGFSDEVSDWLAPVPANHMPCLGGPLLPIAWDSVWELFGNTSHYDPNIANILLKIWENIVIFSVIPISSRVFWYTYCRNHWFELLMSVNRIGDVGDMIDNIQN